MAKKKTARRRRPRRKARPQPPIDLSRYPEAAVTARERAVAHIGGDAQMGAAIGLSRMAIWKWKVIPTERVPAVSGATGIPRHELRPDRPDLFPPPIVLPQTA